MVLKLYLDERSAPVRSVLMTVAALDVKLEFIHLDIIKQEHRTEEFIKINPQHTLPTLEDDGYILWNSNAITPYLVDKYGKDDSLYPKDPEKRGIINQRLFFNEGFFNNAMTEAGKPILFQGAKAVPEDKIPPIHDCYNLLEIFLKDSSWLAGNHVTIADFNVVTGIDVANYLVPIEEKKYPRLAQWYQRVKSLPFYGVTEAGFQGYKKLMESLLAR